MGTTNFQLALIPPTIAPAALLVAVNDRLTRINEIFRDLEVDLSAIRGEDQHTPRISNHLDMTGHRITGGSRSKRPDDFVIRRELEDAGLIVSSPGRLGQRTQATGGGAEGGLTEADVISLINLFLGTEVAPIRDGQVIDLEDPDGEDGATRGTLLFGYGPGGKAKVLRVNANGELVSRNADLEELLEALIAAVGQLTALLEEK